MRFFRSLIVFAAGLFAGRRATRKPVVVRRPGWKRFAKRLAMLVPVLAVLGFLVVVSGIVPIKASSGHWAITEWFLNFSMSRSVATHSMGVKPPPLDDQALVVKGAGHYDTGCRPCHGGVGPERPKIPDHMTPHPPRLPGVIRQWDAAELFYIVKHGVKFTGMPAWPSRERDDEVWAVVAFLLRLPDMDEGEYRALVYGEDLGDAHGIGGISQMDGPDALADVDTSSTGGAGALSPADIPEVVEESCGRCHGMRGEGREVSAFPRLAGQRPEYLYASLLAFAEGERHSGIMEPIAAALTPEEMQEVAAFFAWTDARPRLAEVSGQVAEGRRGGAEGDVDGRAVEPRTGGATGSADQALGIAEPGSKGGGRGSEIADRGREIAERGIPGQKVPSCVDCHGPTRSRRNSIYPNLAGQYADYLALQLKLFQEQRRGGSDYAHLMHHTAPQLSEEDIRAVAQFYEELGGS